MLPRSKNGSFLRVPRQAMLDLYNMVTEAREWRKKNNMLDPVPQEQETIYIEDELQTMIEDEYE